MRKVLLEEIYQDDSNTIYKYGNLTINVEVENEPSEEARQSANRFYNENYFEIHKQDIIKIDFETRNYIYNSSVLVLDGIKMEQLELPHSDEAM